MPRRASAVWRWGYRHAVRQDFADDVKASLLLAIRADLSNAVASAVPDSDIAELMEDGSDDSDDTPKDTGDPTRITWITCASGQGCAGLPTR